MIITSSLLVASVFGDENWYEGYHWVRSQLKGTQESLANQIKTEQVVKHLKRNDFYSAIKLLKGFREKVS